MHLIIKRIRLVSGLFTKAVVILMFAWWGRHFYVTVLDPVKILIIEPPAVSFMDYVSILKNTYKLAIFSQVTIVPKLRSLASLLPKGGRRLRSTA
jgi:hypothetical protein